MAIENNIVSIGGKQEQRIDLFLKKQLAAQAVAVIDAHFVRPSPEEKLWILEDAIRQVRATELSRQIQAGQ